MALEDFERELAQEQSEREKRRRERSRSPNGEQRKRHHHHRHHSSRHDDDHESRDKRHRHHKGHHRHRDGSSDGRRRSEGHSKVREGKQDTSQEDEAEVSEPRASGQARDSWMQAPSALDIDYVKRKRARSPPSQYVKASHQEAHISRQDPDPADEEEQGDDKDLEADTPRIIAYTFGDSGSSWRMTKLRGVFQQAKDTGRSVEDVAVERYGNLQLFDDAREEERELDRRQMYGEGHIGLSQPSGDLFRERALHEKQEYQGQPDVSADKHTHETFTDGAASVVQVEPVGRAPLDQTSLNKLKAQMMKARLRKAPNAASLEAEYNNAVKMASQSGKEASTIVLNKMESRLLAGDRSGEVKAVDNKRGRERQLVEENEDMSIEDMVRNERRSRGQFGGEGRAFAERIAKDSKFDNDLDYLDENASKLAKTSQRSEINLRNTAISEYQKTKRMLETCPLCHHEDTGQSPQAPIVSLATRTFLTLPTAPEIAPRGSCATIVPIQHRLNLLECDDDEWEEMRNFMKSLTRFYWSQKPKMSVVFYENAAHGSRKRHASMEAVPLPPDVAASASAFFKEAILAADEEWTQHKKIIDTLAAANDGMGKLAFRRRMVSNLPYFHVWLSLDGGLGHVVEDARRWPKGDLFARETIGGMLDVDTEVVKRQGRWRAGDADMERRVREFRKGWQKWDWTEALIEAS